MPISQKNQRALYDQQQSREQHELARQAGTFLLATFSGSRTRNYLLNGASANFAWMMLERVARLAIGFVVSIAVARHLGPADFGVFGYAIAIHSIFCVVAALGLDDLLACELARKQGRSSFSAAWRLRVSGALLAYALCLLLSWFWLPDDLFAWVVVAVTNLALLASPWQLIPIWFQAAERMAKPTAARLAALTIGAAIRIALILVEAPLVAFAAAVAFEGLITALALETISPRVNPLRAAGHVPFRQALKLLRHSTPLLASSLVVNLALQTDRLFLFRFSGGIEAGLYVVAARLTEILYAIPFLFGSALIPRLATLHDLNTHAYWKLVRRSGVLCLAVVTAISILLSAASPLLIPAVFGHEYTRSGSLFRIHILSLPFFTAVSLLFRLLVVSGGYKYILYLSSIIMFVALCSYSWAIPRFDATGAAWTTLFTWATSALILPWLFSIPRQILRNCFLSSDTSCATSSH